MCGISGFNFKDEHLIQKMNSKLTHRGPDDEGFYVDKNISLGQRRLSIIDLSPQGRQPIYNENKSLVIILNGEIYNYQKLKKELPKSHKFYSQTDTEVLIHLYEEYGAAMLKKLNGIFSLAIWDKNKSELFLARDRMGVKPLYYYSANNKFIFSSEIKAILEHPDVPREVDLGSMNHYFNLGFVPQPLTMFKNIFKLPSAHYAIFKDNSLNLTKYWQIENWQDIKSTKQAQEKIKYLVDDSIRHQIISDRPVGIFLSGGIDSNIITSIAQKYIPGQINTYSVGFGERFGSKFNADFELARQTAKYLNTNHHELIITEKEMVENLNTTTYHLDEPINNAVHVPVYLLSKMAKLDVAVNLSGAGGDELFGGYPRYRINALIDKWQSLPDFIQNKFLLKILDKITHKNFTQKFTSRSLERYSQFMFRKPRYIQQALQPEIYQPSITSNFYLQKFFNSMPNVSQRDFTRYCGLIDSQTWLLDLDLIMSDKITMAAGLEERVPLLDHRLVELSAQIPTSLKIQKGQTKYLFRQAVKEYIAPHVLNQPKRGFFCPASPWLKFGMQDFTHEILSPDYCPAAKKYLNFQNIHKIFEEHIQTKTYNFVLIWALLIWQIWFKTYIDDSKV